MRKTKFSAICLVSVLLVAFAGGAFSQQATTDIWKLVPPDSLAVAAFDTRPENASVKAIAASQDLQTSVVLGKQREAMRRAVEDFATLFGVSLDFAKDIDPWQDDQFAFVLLPGEKMSKQPVFLLASKDAVAANAAMQKMLEPWSRLGQLTPEPDADFPITAFRMKDEKVEVYVSSHGPVVAVACNKDALKTALRGGGFASGSVADRAFAALSGSIFYGYADASLVAAFGAKPKTIPLTGTAVGASVVDTGMKLRILTYPHEDGKKMFQQVLAEQQPGSLAVNPAVPSNALVAASLPNLSGPVAMAGMMGFAKAPIFGAALAASKLQISGAMTAVLPRPAWVIAGMAESAEAAAEKRAEMEASLRESKIPVTPFAPGVSSIRLGERMSLYATQVDKYVLVADDPKSLVTATAVANGTQPGVAQSRTYQETIAGLGDSNLLTLYANLAPIQGLGYLAEGLGFSQVTPIHDGFAKYLQGVQSLGIGAGFDGDVASATIFLRAKPGQIPTIGPAAIGAIAVGAAILFPMFSNAREQAREAVCMNNMKQLAMAAHLYADDYDGRLPSMTLWRTQLKPYLRKPIEEMQCPCGGTIYAMNKNMAGLKLSQIQDPGNKVLFFEADPDLPNASGSRANAAFAHDGEGTFAFVDTHVERLREAPEQPNWVPVAKKTPSKAAGK